MVYWRKLDGLLMERVQQIFILRAWKCDFAEFRNPRFSGHLAFFNSFFSILEARKFDFCRVVKPMVQDYLHRVRKFYAFWHPLKEWGNFLYFSCLKMLLCAVVKCTFQRHQASCVQIFLMYQTSAFWQPEIAFSADSWNQRFKVPRRV